MVKSRASAVISVYVPARVELAKVNIFDDGVPVTVNNPLNPELPTPVVFAELLTFLSLTTSLTTS